MTTEPDIVFDDLLPVVHPPDNLGNYNSYFNIDNFVDLTFKTMISNNFIEKLQENNIKLNKIITDNSIVNKQFYLVVVYQQKGQSCLTFKCLDVKTWVTKQVNDTEYLFYSPTDDYKTIKFTVNNNRTFCELPDSSERDSVFCYWVEHKSQMSNIHNVLLEMESLRKTIYRLLHARNTDQDHLERRLKVRLNEYLEVFNKKIVHFIEMLNFF